MHYIEAPVLDDVDLLSWALGEGLDLPWLLELEPPFVISLNFLPNEILDICFNRVILCENANHIFVCHEKKLLYFSQTKVLLKRKHESLWQTLLWIYYDQCYIALEYCPITWKIYTISWEDQKEQSICHGNKWQHIVPDRFHYKIEYALSLRPLIDFIFDITPYYNASKDRAKYLPPLLIDE